MKKIVLSLLCGSLCIVAINAQQTWDIGSPNATDVVATLHNDTLTISGTGDMMNWGFRNFMPWNSVRNSIKTVIIGDSITSVGGHAFFNCTNLTSVAIGNNVTIIGDRAFRGASSLTSIVIPNSVVIIDTSAFYDCTALTSVTMGNSVTCIRRWAFQGTSSLTSVTIPNSVTYIGSSAFARSGLTSIVIPNSVTTIGNQAFRDCENLTTVIIGDGVTTIGTGAFFNCINLSSLTLGNNVTIIGDRAFRGASSLTSVVIPNSVIIIDTSAFYGCIALESVTLGNNVEFIGRWAFSGNSSLTSITIPNSVTYIGDRAFQHCTALTSLTVLNAIPLAISANVFHGVNKQNICLYVLPESIDSYSEADVWKNFGCIKAIGDETSIFEFTPIMQIQFYPNPVTNKLHITHEWQSDDIVELFDMNGRRVFSQRINSHVDKFIIDMSVFQHGNYILRIGNQVAKIVKQ